MKQKFLTLIVFLLLSCGVISQNFEVKMLRSFHADSTVFKDKMFKGLSASVGPIGVATPASLILTGFINKDPLMKREGYRAGATLLLSTGISVGIKYTVRRTRPFNKYPDFFHKKGHAGPLSFPSGHTTMAFATATSLTLATKKWYVAVPAYAWAGCAAYSRMYLGVHYPSDILGGMVIGIGSSFLVWKVDQWLQKKYQ